MTQPNHSTPDDAESSTDTSTDTQTTQSTPHDHETVDPEKRQEVLVEYDHRCQSCGQRGPQRDGVATLQVHHIERDPDGMDEHALANLTLLCRACHSWVHQQSTPADSPVALTEADQSELLPQDIEILQYLAARGPAGTSDVADGVSIDLTVSAVRQRLWVLMGLDNLVTERDQQLVDKDVETGEWGLADQIQNSARGHIPDDPQLLAQRIEDEQVRQALERDCDRGAITTVLGISRRTTFNKHKRACAYDFPLAALDRGGPHAGETQGEAAGAVDQQEVPSDEDQRLRTGADYIETQTTQLSPSDPATGASDTPVGEWPGDPDANGHDPMAQFADRLDQALTTLQALEDRLEDEEM
jgi:hypothetical protein